MTSAQKRLRELKDRQSRERGRMAELSLLESLTDEQRSELDTIERGTPDLEPPNAGGCSRCGGRRKGRRDARRN